MVNHGFCCRVAIGYPRLYCLSCHGQRKVFAVRVVAGNQIFPAGCRGQPRFVMRVTVGNQGFAAGVAEGNQGFVVKGCC